MPRQPRLDTPGALHHVMIRGIERRRIFMDDKDRHDFIERLSTLVPETQTSCYAWVLMLNHAHFLLRTGRVGLSTLMRRLLTGYAVTFNRRHKRYGQLFQNRYKSIICQEDMYLKELVRYIHLNPVRGGQVSDLSELGRYPYSGHSVLMGEKKRPWQDTAYVLGFFGKRVGAARKAYARYVEAGLNQGRRVDLVGGGLIRSVGGWKEFKSMRHRERYRVKGDQRILGESGFVMEILAEAQEEFERRYRLKSEGYDLEKVAQRVSQIYRVDPELILSKEGWGWRLHRSAIQWQGGRCWRKRRITSS